LADESKGIVHCLSNQEPIEWIKVMEGQGEVDFQVFEGDGKLSNACAGKVGFDCIEWKGEGKFADVGFDGDFPEGDDTDENGWGGFDLSTDGGWEARIVFEKPDESVGVEDVRHNYM